MIQFLLFYLFHFPSLYFNECPEYDIKQYDGEDLVMLELWGIRSTPLLPQLPASLWPRVVASDRVRSMGKIELNCVLMLNWIIWNRTVYIYKNQAISLMSRVFANGPGDRSSIPGRVIPKTQKIVLDATLLNTQYYKVRIKGNVEQSREWSSTLPYTSVW